VNRGGNLSKSKNPDARDKANRGIKNYSRSKTSTIRGATLVGAGALDVAGLLAAVADTLSGSLLGAVAGQVTDLTA
jgi:hypothetical protein